MKEQMSLNEVQQASLAVLAELDRICREKKFMYWITFGTLIGAVRHKGFIPWDDDIDIAMPRKDYDALINYLLKEYKSSKYEVHTFLTNDKYPFYIARFCDKTHTLIFEHFNYISGCFVDIYPYDGMGKKSDLGYWKSIEPELHAIGKKLTMAEHKNWLYGNSILHKIGNFPQLVMSKIIGRRFFYDKLDKYRNRFGWDESDYVGVVCWSSGTYCYPKRWFESFERVSFENIMVNAPKEYDAILKFLYGNYLDFPPENKRVPQHGFVAFKNDEV